MLYIGRVQWAEIRRIIVWALVGVMFVAMMGLGRSHTAGGRIETWIDVWTKDRTKVAVQDLSDTERSMIAINNGGIMGRGAGQSAVRVEMTHPESDYAFAFFVEEYGIVIAMIVVALYVWIFYRAIEIFRVCPRKYPSLLSLGLALLITGQALLHIMVTVNIMPETGQPLPLISRGGSSLLFTSMALGMILSVSRQNIEDSFKEDL
jgi:cell division protein FtsW